MSEGRRGRQWTVTDAYGNLIYLTQERWEHICDGHPDLVGSEAIIRETVRKGRRYQDPENPQKYYYQLRVPNLPDFNTHVEAVVLFRFGESDAHVEFANNYVVTAYPTELP